MLQRYGQACPARVCSLTNSISCLHLPDSQEEITGEHTTQNEILRRSVTIDIEKSQNLDSGQGLLLLGIGHSGMLLLLLGIGANILLLAVGTSLLVLALAELVLQVGERIKNSSLVPNSRKPQAILKFSQNLSCLLALSSGDLKAKKGTTLVMIPRRSGFPPCRRRSQTPRRSWARGS